MSRVKHSDSPWVHLVGKISTGVGHRPHFRVVADQLQMVDRVSAHLYSDGVGVSCESGRLPEHRPCMLIRVVGWVCAINSFMPGKLWRNPLPLWRLTRSGGRLERIFNFIRAKISKSMSFTFCARITCFVKSLPRCREVKNVILFLFARKAACLAKRKSVVQRLLMPVSSPLAGFRILGFSPAPFVLPPIPRTKPNCVVIGCSRTY